VEGLEDRVTPATMNLPISINNLAVAGTQLVGDVLIAGQKAGTTAIDVTTHQGADCPILHLDLGPINLNLLGLHVDTSEICLDVTAHQGEGLLGDLLCGLTNGDLGLGGVGGILDQLDDVAGQINTLVGQIDNLLDGVLGHSLTVDQVFGAEDANTGFCNILNLSLGPVDLTVLGLNVHLDDCNNGPVTVDVTADPNGGLLGGLLCGLADGGLGGGLGGLIGRIDGLIDQLGDLAGRLDQLDNLPNLGKLTKQVDKLIDRLEKTLDRVDSLQNLDQLIRQVEHTVDQLDRLIDRVA